jgi:D-arabinitol dehydrogenase (NADP+)
MKTCVVLQPKQIKMQEQCIPNPPKNELLVKGMASGICGIDVHVFQGEYLGIYPTIPGLEFAGEVEGAGSGFTQLKAGDRVASEPNISCNNCTNCLNNRQNFCRNWQAVGVTRPGGMA